MRLDVMDEPASLKTERETEEQPYEWTGKW